STGWGARLLSRHSFWGSRPRRFADGCIARDGSFGVRWEATMREDVNDLLDRAVGWYRPRTAPDPASIAGIAGRRRRRRRLGAIAVSTLITLGSLVLLIGTLKPGGSQPPVGSGTPSGRQVPTSTGQ